MALVMSLRGIKKSFGDLDILKNISFDISLGNRIGIVGDNGAGKSTLANIIFGCLDSDGGSIIKHQDEINIGYLFQSTYYTKDNFNNLISDNYDRARQFLQTTSTLGINKVKDWEIERFEGLSGGEKTKLALANIWADKPDMLILDEPTNHLDFQGVQWLIKEIEKFKGTILIISHDRYFLDKTVSKIIEIEYGESHEYIGNYTSYRQEKRRRYESQLHQYEVQEKYKKKIEQDIDQLKNWSDKGHRGARDKAVKNGVKFGGKEFYRAKAKKKDKQVKSKLKRLEKIDIEGVKKPKEEQKINFMFNMNGKRGKRIVEAKEISKAFGERLLFRDSSFYIQRGDRIALFGPNGCGKTTFIKALLGTENLEGKLVVTSSIKVSYLSQDVLDLDGEKLPLQVLKCEEGERRSRAQTLLASMGFKKDMIIKPIKYWSLGERTRLKIADIVLNENDILILDEPTNHLDLHSREKLEETLEEYQGTIILVSHDRYMLERICDKMLIFKDEKIQRLEYGFKEYMKRKESAGKDSLKEKINTEKEKRNRKSIEEDIMVIETKIACVLGELSKHKPEDEEYKRLDTEFKELIIKKNNLKG